MASSSLEGSWEVVVDDVASVLTISSLGFLGRKRTSVVIKIFRGITVLIVGIHGL